MREAIGRAAALRVMGRVEWHCGHRRAGEGGGRRRAASRQGAGAGARAAWRCGCQGSPPPLPLSPQRAHASPVSAGRPGGAGPHYGLQAAAAVRRLQEAGGRVSGRPGCRSWRGRPGPSAAAPTARFVAALLLLLLDLHCCQRMRSSKESRSLCRAGWRRASAGRQRRPAVPATNWGLSSLGAGPAQQGACALRPSTGSLSAACPEPRARPLRAPPCRHAPPRPGAAPPPAPPPPPPRGCRGGQGAVGVGRQQRRQQASCHRRGAGDTAAATARMKVRRTPRGARPPAGDGGGAGKGGVVALAVAADHRADAELVHARRAAPELCLQRQRGAKDGRVGDGGQRGGGPGADLQGGAEAQRQARWVLPA